MGNEANVQVQDIDIYKLELHEGRALLLYDIFYASEVQQNLF